MEPNLERLLERNLGAAHFPQYADRWDSAFEQAQALMERIASNAPGRPRVGFAMGDPLGFCAAFLAMCRCGFDLFFYDPKWGAKERKDALEISDPHCVVEFDRPGGISGTFRNAAARISSDRKGCRFMIPTGGTSGKVRFVIHDWSSVAASAYGLQMNLGADRINSHCVLPLHHVSGFMQLIRSLLSVGRIAFGSTNDFQAVAAVLKGAGEEPRFLSVVPTQLDRLTADDSLASVLREYKAIFLGGAPASRELRERCRELRLPVSPVYGMSETASQVVSLTPGAFLDGRSGTGHPMSFVRIDIVDEETLEKVERGASGRIRIYSASLFRGYYGEKESAIESLLTTDLGRFDDHGDLRVLGRLDQVVNSGGEKINPREVELAIEGTGLVKDVAVFGIEDREWGQKLAAAYVPKDSFVKENVLADAVRSVMASFKVPKIWIPVEALPRNEAGKIQAADLLALR